MERSKKDKSFCRADASLPNIKLFVTEADQKESRMLPSLQKSKFAASTSRKEKQNQDSRDFTLIIRKYNEIKHENDILIEKIEEIKRSQGHKMNKNCDEIAQLHNLLTENEVKKAQIEKSLKNQMELRKKLEVIIKVCDMNKMYGSETDYLSYYLENIKKMIDIEEAKIK